MNYLFHRGGGPDLVLRTHAGHFFSFISVKLPLIGFKPTVDLKEVIQFKVDGNDNVKFNNLFFGGTAPYSPPPSPPFQNSQTV